MISDMWEEFPDVIDNENEAFWVDIYTTTKAKAATGTTVETPVHKFWDKALWIYPKETLQMEYLGKLYTVEVILLFKPGVPVEKGDILYCSHRPNNILRCGGIIDPRTHLEVMCFSPHGISLRSIPKTRNVMVDSIVV